MDRRVTLEKPSGAPDPTYGSAPAGWATLAVVWAEVRDAPPSRDENVRNGLATGKIQTRVRIRYRGDVDSTVRIRFGSRTLRVLGGPAEIGRREYMELYCEQSTAEGGA